MQVLRTVLSNADKQGLAVFLHFDKPKEENLKPNVKNLDLNQLMQNVDREHFSYESFKKAFDTDERLKGLIANFDSKGIELKTQQSNTIKTPTTPDSKSKVKSMAKRATNLKDKL